MGFENPLYWGALVGGIGMASLVIGGIWSVFVAPSDRTRSIVQHLAAGTIFAGLSADVLFRLLQGQAQIWIMVLGTAGGLSLMLFIRGRGHHSGSGLVLGFVIIADVLTDGLLMGLSVNAGPPPSPVALVFVASLLPELTFLGLTLSDELGGEGWRAGRLIGLPALVGAGVVAGGVLGGYASTGPEGVRTGIESFGAIVLAYTVMEELLREAHEHAAGTWIAAMFFVGFIPFFLAAAAVG